MDNFCYSEWNFWGDLVILKEVLRSQDRFNTNWKPNCPFKITIRLALKTW